MSQTHGIECLQYTPIDNGKFVRGKADLLFRSTGLILHECTLQERDGSMEVRLPTIGRRQADGTWKYEPIGKWVSDAYRKGFSAVALAAIDAWIDRQNGDRR